MDSLTIVTMLAGGLGMAGSLIVVWVSLRERLVRAETLISVMQEAQKDHKSDVNNLKEWLEVQFKDLRRGIDSKEDKQRRADRDG